MTGPAARPAQPSRSRIHSRDCLARFSKNLNWRRCARLMSRRAHSRRMVADHLVGDGGHGCDLVSLSLLTLLAPVTLMSDVHRLAKRRSNLHPVQVPAAKLNAPATLYPSANGLLARDHRRQNVRKNLPIVFPKRSAGKIVSLKSELSTWFCLVGAPGLEPGTR